MTPGHRTVQEGLSMVSCREGITCFDFVIPSLSLSIYNYIKIKIKSGRGNQSRRPGRP